MSGTSEQSIGDFLKDEVYPRLDAVEAGLLDSLNPSSLRGSGSYSLDCPKCKEPKEAFYYPHSSAILCNRKKDCAVTTSLWDFLLQIGNNRPLPILCNAAGVSPPSSRQKPTALTDVELSVRFIRICREAAKLEVAAQDVGRFCQGRSLTLQQFELLGYGYFPSSTYVAQKLRESHSSTDMAHSLKFIFKQNEFDRFKGRIVMPWKQENGFYSFAARLPEKVVPKEAYKILFHEKLAKSVPYAFSRKRPGKLHLIEGISDADALYLMDYWAAAVGGNGLTEGQVTYLVKQGIQTAVFITDSDRAGLEGAQRSVDLCEQAGIYLEIVLLDADSDDADTLRASGRESLLKELVEKKLSPGDFIARIYIDSLLNPSSKDRRYKIERTLGNLTSTTRFVFNQTCATHGLVLNPEIEKTRLRLFLLSVGTPTAECEAICSKRFTEKSNTENLKPSDRDV